MASAAEAEAEPPESPEASAEAAEAAEAVEEAASRHSQGGRAQGAVVADLRLDDPDGIQALTSPSGKVRVTRESLQTGLTAEQAQLLWDWAMQQHARCESAKRATKRFMRDIESMLSNRRNELLGANGPRPISNGHAAARAAAAANGHPQAPSESNDKQPQQPHQQQHAPIARPFELRAGGHGYVGYGSDRWQRKKIGRKSIAKRLSEGYAIELVQDVVDSNGVPFEAGDKSNASYCGAFPHALIRPKVGKHKGEDVYVCSGSLEVVLTIRLHDRTGVGHASERHVLEDLRKACTEEELEEGWGEFETSLQFHIELQFARDDVDLDNPQNWICANVNDFENNAFKKAPPGQTLLSPPEHVPYTKGRQEMRMIDGKAETQFGFNQHVTTNNLGGHKTRHLFRFAIRCLNPYLNGLSSFNVVSAPFVIKRSLHNHLAANERWVKDDKGALTKVPTHSVPRFAPSRPGSVAKRGGGGGGGEAVAPLGEEEAE